MTGAGRFAVLGAAGALGAAALLSGCASGSAGGPEAEAARTTLSQLGERIIAQVDGDETHSQEGTTACAQGADEGVDWTSLIEFAAAEYPERIGDAEALLVREGYAVKFGSSPVEFVADGPNGETIVLTDGELTLFTGCVVG